MRRGRGCRGARAGDQDGGGGAGGDDCGGGGVESVVYGCGVLVAGCECGVGGGGLLGWVRFLGGGERKEEGGNEGGGVVEGDFSLRKSHDGAYQCSEGSSQ